MESFLLLWFLSYCFFNFLVSFFELNLDELFKLYEEDDIKTDRKSIPRITYYLQDNQDNKPKKRYYFPDIYIVSINKIIEVKSSWTYKQYIEKIKLKAEATKKAGYDYKIWIYDNKKNKTIVWNKIIIIQLIFIRWAPPTLI